MSDFESFGSLFGGASKSQGFSAAGWQSPRHRWNNFVTRAITRAIIGALPAGAGAAAAMFAYSSRGEDKASLAFAVGLTVLFVLACRWFGKARGILWGLWLWVLSVGLTNGITALAGVVTEFLKTPRGVPVDEAGLLAAALIWGGLGAACFVALKRIDPDN